MQGLLPKLVLLCFLEWANCISGGVNLCLVLDDARR